MRSSNPVLEKGFRSAEVLYAPGERMTLDRTVNKTALLLAIVSVSAIWPWNTLTHSGPAAVLPFIWAGLIGGTISALAIIFKKEWAAFLSPVYAVCQGLALGAISSLLEMRFPGIALQAVGATFGTLAVMLLAYKSGMIRVTEHFKLGVIAATGGIAVIYLVSMGLGFFGVSMPLIHGSGIGGIIFSLVVVGVASLNLILDFDMIEEAAKTGAPRYMEWYGAFALMVTLVWLYLEMLKLLSKFRSRN